MKFISYLFKSVILKRNRKETPPKSQVFMLHRHSNTILYYTCFYIVLNFIFWRGLFAPPWKVKSFNLGVNVIFVATWKRKTLSIHFTTLQNSESMATLDMIFHQKGKSDGSFIVWRMSLVRSIWLVPPKTHLAVGEITNLPAIQKPRKVQEWPVILGMVALLIWVRKNPLWISPSLTITIQHKKNY